MLQIEIRTKNREEMIDITGAVQEALTRARVGNGAALLFCVHTTCGLTINEGADPAVRLDIEVFFGRIAPREGGWRHAEGNSDAHIRASLLGPSLVIPVENGRLCLGRWQAIYLYEGDGPRPRTLLLQWLAGMA